MAATFSSSSALAADVSTRVSAGWEGDVETAWGDEFAPLLEGDPGDLDLHDAPVLTAGDEDFYDLGEREFTVEIDDDTGERFLDVEQAGPRDRQVEAQEYLEQAMTSGRALVRRSVSRDDESLFPTRNEAVDRLLAGGIGRGEMVEVTGWRSSGRFSLVLSLVAATTQSGESVALVDLGDHLDPASAQVAGVDLERVLWMRPETVKQALGCAEMALGVGFAMVVLDLGTPPLRGGRGAEAAWLRLQRAALANRCALFVSAPYRVSGTAAHVVLELHRGNGGWLGQGTQPQLFGGLFGQVELTKARCPRLQQVIEERRERSHLQAENTSPPTERAAQTKAPATPQLSLVGSDPSSEPEATDKIRRSRSKKSAPHTRSLQGTALEMALRFALRHPSTSVAELAAPMRRIATRRWWEMPQSRLKKGRTAEGGRRQKSLLEKDHLPAAGPTDRSAASDEPGIELVPEPMRRHQVHERFLDVRADLGGVPNTNGKRSSSPPQSEATRPDEPGPPRNALPLTEAPLHPQSQEVLHAG